MRGRPVSFSGLFCLLMPSPSAPPPRCPPPLRLCPTTSSAAPRRNALAALAPPPAPLPRHQGRPLQPRGQVQESGNSVPQERRTKGGAAGGAVVSHGLPRVAERADHLGDGLAIQLVLLLPVLRAGGRGRRYSMHIPCIFHAYSVHIPCIPCMFLGPAVRTGAKRGGGAWGLALPAAPGCPPSLATNPCRWPQPQLTVSCWYFTSLWQCRHQNSSLLQGQAASELEGVSQRRPRARLPPALSRYGRQHCAWHQCTAACGAYNSCTRLGHSPAGRDEPHPPPAPRERPRGE